MKIRTIGIIGTLIVHLTVVFIAASSNGTQYNRSNESSDVEITFIALADTSSVTAKPKQGISGGVTSLQCKPSQKLINGVGVAYFGPKSSEILIGLITQADKQFPGYQGGLRLHDIILNIKDVDKIDVDGNKTFIVDREGKTLKFLIKVRNICYDETVVDNQN